jgi:membrane-bound serine protease (ClpP class)
MSPPRNVGVARIIADVLRRISVFLLILTAALTFGGGLAAQDDDLPVVVLDLEKPFDQRLMDFAVETLGSTPAHLFVLQVDSPGIASGDVGPLISAIETAEAPVAVWVGARPAVAYGGVASLLNRADLGAAAPGTRVGYLDPAVMTDGQVIAPRIDRFRGSTDQERTADAMAAVLVLTPNALLVEEPIEGFVEEVVPSIGQLIVGLDGEVLTRGDVAFEIETAETVVLEDGTEVVSPSRLVQFLKPGLWDRFLRLASEPEAMFFFIVAAIAAATFEFYAAGVGVSAVASVLAFLLAGYGLATLPVSWPSVGGVVVGLGLYTWDFQRNRLGFRSVLGTVLLIVGGLTITNARPQMAPVWWIVLIVVAGAALFYGVGLTTIVRSRFSTTTIGREYLIGQRGRAETTFDPEGIVVVGEARWRGRAHREAAIQAGDGIEVTGVEGIVLDVEPVD